MSLENLEEMVEEEESVASKESFDDKDNQAGYGNIREQQENYAGVGMEEINLKMVDMEQAEDVIREEGEEEEEKVVLEYDSQVDSDELKAE